MNPITRSELFMAAAAGENVTLPTPTTREEYFLKKIADNAGGGGAGELVVTVNAVSTLDADVEPQYTASHTIADIMEAFQAMKNVRVIFDDGSGVINNIALCLISVPDLTAVFYNPYFGITVGIGPNGVFVEQDR